jgi:hypothetical protein
MLKTFKGGDNVKGGFYFNRHDWTMRVAPREGEVLPGGEIAVYYRFPTLMFLVAAPLLGLMFAMFLPFIGLALIAKVAVDKVAYLWNEGRATEKAADTAK